MIRSFRHAGIEKFFRSGSKAGIQASHADKLNIQLTTLNRSKGPPDMAALGWNLHPLHGNLQSRPPRPGVERVARRYAGFRSGGASARLTRDFVTYSERKGRNLGGH